MTRTGDKISLINIKFFINACKKLSEREINSLSVTARDCFYFVQSFGNKLKVRNCANLWLMEDQIKDLDGVT